MQTEVLIAEARALAAAAIFEGLTDLQRQAVDLREAKLPVIWANKRSMANEEQLEIELKRILSAIVMTIGLTAATCMAANPVPTVQASFPQPVLLTGAGAGSRIVGCDPVPTGDVFDRMQVNFRRMVPDDCQSTSLAPPLFIWTEPRDTPSADASALLRNPASPFEITVRRSSGAVVVSQQTLRTAAAFSSRDAVWGAGDYTWTIAFVAKSGARIEGAPRRFRILPGAVALDWPDGKTLAATVAARPFPRALPTGQSFAGLKLKIDAGEYSVPWKSYEALTRSYLSTTAFPLPRYPVQIDQYLRGGPESIAAAIAWQSPIQNEQRMIQSLAYAYRLTSDYRFKDAALLRMSNLVSWPLSGATVLNPDFDLVNRAVYRALAEGLDVMWNDIEPGQRAIWINAIKVRMQPILKAFEGFATEPYQSHLVGETTIALETLLHVAGMPGFPEAQTWLAEAWERFRFGFNVWGGEDGGYSNSVAYGWYTLEMIPATNAALRVIAGVDMSRHPYVKRQGLYQMAMIAPAMDGLFLPFGDGTETSKFFAWYTPDYYRLNSAVVRDPAQEWYWRINPAATGTNPTGKLSPWHFLMLGLALPPVKAVESSAGAYVSVDAGVGAIFSKMSDPARSALYMRSSRYGSVSHSHADQNAITFDSRGQNMLISSGYYPWYGSAHHMGVTRLTRFKNALTFDNGIGQNETVDNPLRAPTLAGLTNYSMDSHGEIVNFSDGARWGVITGDASNAYRPRQRSYPYAYGTAMVDSALRSSAYDRLARIAVIYDYAHSGSARQWELNFHGLSPFKVNGSALRIDRNGAALCIDVYGPDGSFNTSQGFPIAPEASYPSAQYPEQYHGRFSAAKASTELASITVLREDCANTRVDVVLQGSKATVTLAGGAPIVFDRKQVWVPN
jgi:hypothetical protein